ncbi:MAG TPA: hypothetical protein VFI14_07215 [Chryseosolibacter sp.]|jgi:hypothetical protein|nr:hypothetical protein [Chryseosolibacter sp.]
MKEIIVKYTDSKTLALLKTLARFFNFSVSSPTKEKGNGKTYEYINGVPIIPGDGSISVTELTEIFTGKNLNARKLRIQEWQRQK